MSGIFSGSWGRPGFTGDNQNTNFQTRVMGNGNQELRQFVEQNIVSSSHNNNIERVMKYHLYKNFYEGHHWKDFNESFATVNYVKAFIDKVLNFMVNKEGFSISVMDVATNNILPATDMQHQAIEKFLLRNWNRNGRWLTSRNIIQMGSIMGDCWVGARYVAKTPLTPEHIKYETFDSRFCFPEFSDGDFDSYSAFVIRQPLVENDKKYIVKVIRITNEFRETWFQKNTALEAERFEFTQATNDYGFIPVVHFKNTPLAAEYFSRSDASEILKLNKIYNELTNNMKAIIDYYAAPVTVITGANAKSLKRGLGNIWSGLPAESNVFNLAIGADLGASFQFRESIKTSMHELADVPENTLGQLQAISNTSGAATEMTYLPLIHQCDLKSMSYNEGFNKLHVITLAIAKNKMGSNPDVKAVSENFFEDYITKTVWSYGLPKDQMSLIDQARAEIGLSIGSRREWMEKLKKDSIEELIKQIDQENEKYGELGAKEKEGGTKEPSGNTPNQNTNSGANPPTNNAEN